ncbi:hypothetical protein [Streptomyces hiroshimensis]|uniref:Secreted protein n=1 Tax=Streptomyces hiroshimensis TaxID=66424 RepID=A0ABQ2ZA70_9ACTN|nr:hypothetical protein [Streptomyces hiroshimensis]GGY06991.1 hypothetical protein GCM10010324_62280 [Streptomyces hiroshimensis]
MDINMKSKALRRTTTAVVSAATAAAVMATLAPAAQAAEPAEKSTVKAAQKARYTDEEIVGLFTLGSGRAATEHPEVLKKFGIPQQKVDAARVASLTSALRKTDPAFHQAVTQNVQSGNPYKVEKALTTLSADVQAVSNGKGNRADAVALGSWWFKTQQAVVQTGTVATTVAAVAEVGVVFVVAYRSADDTSQFTKQAMAASVARAL